MNCVSTREEERVGVSVCVSGCGLTISTAVDGSPVLPPPDALASHPPFSGGDTAVATQLREEEEHTSLLYTL